MEKQVLEDKVANLEAKLASATTASGTRSSDTATSSSSSAASVTVSSAYYCRDESQYSYRCNNPSFQYIHH